MRVNLREVPVFLGQTAIGGFAMRSWHVRLCVVWIGVVVWTCLWNAANADLAIADWLYRLQGGAWNLRDSALTETLVHKVGGAITRLAALIVIFYCIRRLFVPTKHPRNAYLYLLLALLSPPLIVLLMKSTLPVDCPWDLQRYGGTFSYDGLFSSGWSVGRSGCFPAGHASGGYAWIALFFYFRATRPALQWRALAIALGVGAVFGICQQLRGAHFLSHDVWTLVVCWTFSYVLSHTMLDVSPADQRKGAAHGR